MAVAYSVTEVISVMASVVVGACRPRHPQPAVIFSHSNCCSSSGASAHNTIGVGVGVGVGVTGVSEGVSAGVTEGVVEMV